MGYKRMLHRPNLYVQVTRDRADFGSTLHPGIPTLNPIVSHE
jgi:hypothetical protein